jgi:hypothetical protein
MDSKIIQIFNNSIIQMSMDKLRYIFLLMFLCALIVSCDRKKTDNGAEVTADVTYLANDAKFPNPERGFYKYSDTNLGSSPSSLSEGTLKAYRSQNITLLFRYFYIKQFRDKALSAAALEQINADMDVIRKSGMKCVMRFAYSSAADEADAPLNIILQHLDQLKPVLEQNADVIAVLQAGFIGAWGEWYYSSNNLKNAQVRADILNKMLEVLPERRMVQLRTPIYKTDYLQRTTPLLRNEAFTGSKAARLGHHNDCFLASATDYGTYTNVEADKTYINSDALYVPVGGETCPPDGVSPADCQKAENEMRNLRWSFLNDDYFRGVNNNWVTQGCMDNIIRSLGYRFALNSATYTAEAAAGGTLNIRIKLNNTGYASLFNPRKVEFILKNSETAQIYIAETGEDPRFWSPQTITEVKLSLGIPKDMPEGSYNLYLNLPDPEPLLYGNPDYSVQLANKDVWEPATGYNNLFQTVEIKKTSSASYDGDLWFKKK